MKRKERFLGGLFVVVAAATFVQQARHLLAAVWGAPVRAIQYVGLVGSVILLVAGALVLLNRASGRALAMVGLATLWMFYGPALVMTAPQVVAASSDRGAVLVLIPGLLLIAATAQFLFTFRSGVRAQKIGAG